MVFDSQIRTIAVGVILLLLAIFFFKKKQSKKLNWALAYSFIWQLFSLSIFNYYCVELNLWYFTEDNLLKIPYDIFFIWLFLWGGPFYLFKGKYMFIIILFLLWVDILMMPYLNKVGILKLNFNWIAGEFIILLFVFLPSYLWAKFSYENTYIGIRALFQVIVMSMFLIIIIPFCVNIYQIGTFDSLEFSSFWFQIIVIITFPSFIAVIDLVEKGVGTPFPYDKTQNLVETGVYAYIKNPIQWSFTMLFIPLSIYHQSFLLFLGFFISIIYTFGVSNQQEKDDMKERFGSLWSNYNEKIQSWFFLWKPSYIPKGTIYFKRNCNQCEGLKVWFEKQVKSNLEIKYSDSYKKKELLQVTYIHHLGKEYKNIKAIAHGLEHINLGYASLGWFMRFPIINFVLQVIVNSLGFSEDDKYLKCKNNKK